MVHKGKSSVHLKIDAVDEARCIRGKERYRGSNRLGERTSGLRTLLHAVSTTFTAHSAGSESATALVVAFRPRAASHRQMT